MSETLEIPCLGRQFQLGIPYDVRTDQLNLGVALWNAEKMRNLNEIKNKAELHVEVVSGDPYELASRTKLNNGLKLSLLAGLVNVSGAAKCFTDHNPLKPAVQVTMRCEMCLSNIEIMPSVENLAEVQLSDIVATHVITKISLGCEIYFVFQQQITQKDDPESESRKLLAKVKALAESCKQTSDVIQTLETDDAIICSAFSDFTLPAIPSTYSGAISVCNSLPSVMKEKCISSPVPLTASLYPIAKLDSKRNQIIREISNSLVNQVEGVFIDMKNTMCQSVCLKDSDPQLFSMFPFLQDQQREFFYLINEYKEDIIRELRSVIPRIRSGDDSESQLADLLKKHSCSPFGSRKLSNWLTSKDKEFKSLRPLILKRLQKFEFHTSENLSDVVFSGQHERVICLAFNVIGKTDGILREMQAYLNHEQATSSDCNITWYSNQQLMKTLMISIKQFVRLSESSSTNEKYVLTDYHDCDGNGEPCLVIYEDGIYQIFNPPSEPGKPTLVCATDSTIELMWEKPNINASTIDYYTILYCCEDNQSDQWKKQKTSGNTESGIISGLTSKTTYIFEVYAETKDGFGPVSDISDPIKTKPSLPGKPGKPEIYNITQCSVEVKWTKPSHNPHLITHYSLLYCSPRDASDTWSEVNIVDTNANVSLLPKTKYIFKVCAHTKECSGPASDISDPIETKPVVPGKPGRPVISNIECNSVKVEWTRPSEDDHGISFYTVSYSSTGGDDWDEAKTNDSNSSIDIVGLTSKTIYIFKVRAERDDYHGPYSEISDLVQTKPALPGKPGKPQVIGCSHNSIKINWDEPDTNANEITKYTVFYCPDNNVHHNWMSSDTASAQETFINITGLADKTSYLFKVCALTTDGTGEESDVSDPIETSAITPSRPGKPEVCNITHNSIGLEWSKPALNPHVIKQYVIKYGTPSDKPECWKTLKASNVEKVEVRKLLPKTTYLFTVSALSKDTAGPESESSEPITTKAVLPGRPTKLQVRNVTSSSAEIRWNKPNSNSHLINSYTIFSCANDESFQQWEKRNEVPGNVKSAVVSDLNPSSAYVLKVCPNSEDGPGLESEPTDIFYTKHVSPGKPSKPLISVVTHNTAQIDWIKPQLNAQCIHSYTLYYRTDKDPQDRWKRVKTCSAQETFLVKDLLPKATYTFKVAAEGQAGMGPQSEESEPKTTNPVYPGKPGKPEHCEVKHDSVTLRWEKPTVHQRHAKFYTVLYRAMDDSLGSWEKHPVSHAESRGTSAVISGLKSKTMYIFKVRAENEDGLGSESANSDLIETKGIIPGRPGQPTVENVTHNSMQVQWTKPHTHAASIVSYTVFYCKANAPSDQWRELNVSPAQESSTVHGLSPKTKYIFQVCAKSTDGVSKKSESSIPQETKPVLPGRPGIPQVSNIKATSVQVNWVEPEHASLVTSYTLFYGIPQKVSHIDWKNLKTHEKSIIVEKLTAKTPYIFKVAAESIHGVGPESEVSDKIVTKALLPGKPGKPQVSKTTPNSVEVRWSKPTANPQCVKSYTVLYRANSDPKGQWRVEKTTNAQEYLVISGLSSKTTYLFKVRPESEVGSSAESEQSDPFEIKPVTPGKPGKPDIISTDSISAHLRWKKPEFGAEDVSNYKIIYCCCDNLTKRKWSVQKTKDAQEHTTIYQLQSDTVYFFKVQAESESGCGPESDCSDPCKTDLPPLSMRMREISTLVDIKGGLSIFELPFVYDMKTDTKTMLARCHIGQPESFKPGTEKVLMVVGATGAGKSTLINGFANYILGVQWNDDFRFKIKESEEIKKSQVYSQTSWITAYTFHPMQGSRTNYTLTVIDTPGFGDTSGIEKDKLVVNQIKEFFSIPGENGVDQLHGIGFVTQASLARLTTTQKYIFHSILAVFGKNIADNIFMLTTFSDGQKPPVLEAVSAADVTYKAFFKFNNSALFAEPQPDNFDKMFWDLGMKSFENFFTEFEKAKAQSLQLTQEVLFEREKLEAVVEGLQPQIHFGLSKIDEIRQEEQILKEKEAEINANKKFTYEVTLTKQRKIDLKRGHFVTNCLQCNYTCHYPCKIAKDEEKYRCAAMMTHDKDAICKVCPQKCSWNVHYNNTYRFEIYEEKETRTEEDLKKKYLSATAGKNKVESMINSMESELETLYEHVMHMIMDAQQSVKRLQEIALKPNPLTEVEYIDLLIESEKQEKKPGFLNRIRTYNQLREKAKLLSKMKTESTAAEKLNAKGGKGVKAWWQFWKS